MTRTARIGVAVADLSRARLFTLDRIVDAGHARGTPRRLVERIDLVNAGRRLTPAALFSPAPPGDRPAASACGCRDHHGDVVEHVDRAFAAEVAAELRRLIAQLGLTRVVLCVTPRVLADLQAAAQAVPVALEVHAATCHLVGLPPDALLDELVAHGMVPAADVGERSLRRRARE